MSKQDLSLNTNQLMGGLWGLLLGDAVGVPYEFNKPAQLPQLEHIDMQPPNGFKRTYTKTPVGTWSDDGATALALLDSLLDCGTFNADDFGQRLVDWYNNGAYAVDQQVFDVGIQTAQAIRQIEQGMPSLYAGGTDEHANGNGSLMRALAVVLWYRGDDAGLIELAEQQSRPTHAHRRSRVCCALYCLWARYIASGDAAAWQTAIKILRQHYQTDDIATEQLEFFIRPDDDIIGTGSGYVVDSLRSAKQIFDLQLDFKSSIKAAIALGDDTDTTACIAGGVIGLREGFEQLPAEWLSQLRGEDILLPIWDKLAKRHTLMAS